MRDAAFESFYIRNIERRRDFHIDGYSTLAEAGYDGEYVTPYQIASRSADGPVLVANHWLDAPTAIAERNLLSQLGYFPKIKFNRVMDISLRLAGLTRGDIYVTQAFHLLPAKREQRIPIAKVRQSFDAITRHELAGRRVIALGGPATAACRDFGIRCESLPHPSARGATEEERGKELAEVLVRFRS